MGVSFSKAINQLLGYGAHDILLFSLCSSVLPASICSLQNRGYGYNKYALF